MAVAASTVRMGDEESDDDSLSELEIEDEVQEYDENEQPLFLSLLLKFVKSGNEADLNQAKMLFMGRVSIPANAKYSMALQSRTVKRNALHICAANKELTGALKWFLQDGSIKVNEKTADHYKETPLGCAIMHNNVAGAEVLLKKKKVNKEARNVKNMTPLMTAAVFKNINMIKLLLIHGCNPRAKIGAEITPVHFARLRGADEKVISLLTMHELKKEMEDTKRVDVTIETDSHNNPRFLKFLGSFKKTLDRNDLGRCMALYVHRNKVPANATLLYKRKSGSPQLMNALHICAESPKMNLCLKWFLIDGSIDPNERTNDNYLYTPLMFAVLRENKKCAKILLKDERVDINIGGSQNFTALMVAAYHDIYPMVKFLIKHGADKTILSASGRTAYRIAQKIGAQSEVLELLKI